MLVQLKRSVTIIVVRLSTSARHKSAVVDCEVKDHASIKFEEQSGSVCTGCSYSNANFDETNYYFDHGLRKVYPYYFTHRTFCKGRWLGKRLLDVYCKEFVGATEEYMEERILSGQIKVNGQTVPLEYQLKNLDRITSTIHRHEMAVLAAPIKIISSNDEVVIVDKPPSLPVHPIGIFRHNSVLFILAKEHDLKGLHIINRLDRLTSGVVLFAKNVKRARELQSEMVARKIQKEYVCRVEGLFPDGIVTCSEPLRILHGKISICHVAHPGRKSLTQFERISYNGKSSVVLCRPLTGRTHQIRVHLQYLGHPIVNDPIYNSYNFGPMKGKGGEFGRPFEDILNDVLKSNSRNSVENMSGGLILDHLQASILQSCESTSEYHELSKKYIIDPNKFHVDTNCRYCNSSYRDPVHKYLFIFLHALRYKGDGWDYSTEMPDWAKADWDVS